MSKHPKTTGRVRYAVVGMGHIAQVAILPGFAHAKRNSELAAIVSGSEEKRDALEKKYRVPVYSYDAYNALLNSGAIDAVFIALPNHLHADFVVRAARGGVHILCEKPMAMTSRECRRMIAARDAARVKLMIAYRLHFEEGNMEAVRLARARRIGEPRFFHSSFSRVVKSGNYRMDSVRGGGSVYDLGVYCINAARYLFRAEPIDVTAVSATGNNPRFKGIPEMTSVTLRYPGERLATFICSFGASDTSVYILAGTKGTIKMDPAYEYVGQREMTLTVGEKSKKRRFGPVDQFAAQLLYFSDCVLHNRLPEPSGEEGLADIQIIEAIHKSARLGRRVLLRVKGDDRHPTFHQTMKRPPAPKPELVAASSSNG